MTREAAGPGRSKHWKRSTHPSRRARKLYPLQSFPARAGLVPREPTARQHTQPPPVTKCSHTPIWSLSLITKNKRECPLLCKKVGPTPRRKRQRDRAGASIGSDPPTPRAERESSILSKASLRAQAWSRGSPPPANTPNLLSLEPVPFSPGACPPTSPSPPNLLLLESVPSSHCSLSLIPCPPDLEPVPKALSPSLTIVPLNPRVLSGISHTLIYGTREVAHPRTR